MGFTEEHLIPLVDAGLGDSAYLAGLGTYPAYFARLGETNRMGPAPVGEPPAPPALTPARVRALLRDRFATWLGWAAATGRPLRENR